MAEKDQVIREQVEHKGIFDFRGLYSFAHSWFQSENYDGVDEEKYSEKLAGSAKNIDIEWKATKRLSDYFKIEQKLKFEIKDLTDVEVEIDGKTKKMNNGSIKIEIKGTLVVDPDSKWETSAFYKFIRDVYSKYVVPARVDSMKMKTSTDVKNLKEEIKAYLDLTGRR